MSDCGNECYKIGGPWINFDPQCPVHGYEAQAREREQELERQTLEDRIVALERAVELLMIGKSAYD